jgi:hypothetical protein
MLNYILNIKEPDKLLLQESTFFCLEITHPFTYKKVGRIQAARILYSTANENGQF